MSELCERHGRVGKDVRRQLENRYAVDREGEWEPLVACVRCIPYLDGSSLSGWVGVPLRENALWAWWRSVFAEQCAPDLHSGDVLWDTLNELVPEGGADAGRLPAVSRRWVFAVEHPDRSPAQIVLLLDEAEALVGHGAFELSADHLEELVGQQRDRAHPRP